MIDREKVIKALACCVFPVSKGFPYQSHIADKGCEAVECPYRDDCDQMLLDALELLKEQEQQEQKLGKWIVEKPNSYTTDIYCSVCGGAPPFVFVSDDYYAVHSHGETKKTKYCPHCGAKMKVECDE